jgi:hypothetical protein
MCAYRVFLQAVNNKLNFIQAGSNTVQLFSIDPLKPASLTPLGNPVPSGGQFPNSLTFNDAGDVLCVLNDGADASVQCVFTSLKPDLILY